MTTAIVAADYQILLSALHRVQNTGGHLTTLEVRQLIMLIRDSVTRMGGGEAGLDAITDVLVTEVARVATAKSNMVTSIATLAAYDTEGEVTGAGAAATAAAVAAVVSDWATNNTSLATFATNAGAQIVLLDAFEAALGTAPTLVTNSVMDGAGGV